MIVNLTVVYLGTVGFRLLGHEHLHSLILTRAQRVLTYIAVSLRDAVVNSGQKGHAPLKSGVRQGELVSLNGCGDTLGPSCSI